MEQVISVILDNSVAIGCLIYFMWFNNTTMKENNKLLTSMDKRLTIIEKCLGLDSEEDKKED